VAIEIAQVGKTVEPHPDKNQEFLILISDNFWNIAEIQEAIDQYQDDVYQHRQIGSRVFMVSPAEIPFGSKSSCGGDIESAEEIREFLKYQYYDESPARLRLVGVILIGDLPWVNVKLPNGNFRIDRFGVSDVYFGELDFEGWILRKYQGCHYLEIPYCDGGCIHPEIWVARIFPPVCFDLSSGVCKYPNGGFSFPERIEMLLRFFEKDHRYWIEGISYYNFLVIELGDEEIWLYGTGGFPVEEGDEVIREDEVNKKEFFDYLKTPFKMADLLIHGRYDRASLGNESFGPQEIFEAEIQIPVILVNSCSGARFDYQNTFPEGYLFGKNSETITTIGLGATTYALMVPFLLRDYYIGYIGRTFQRVKCWAQDDPQAFVIIEGDPFVKVATDTSPPSISISGNCPAGGGKFEFKARASDPSGIEKIELWVNGELKNTCYSSSCSCIVDGKEGQTYTLKVNAWDNSSKHNEGSKSKTITCKKTEDTTPPEVTYTSPSCDSNGKVTITVTAEDDESKVGHISVFITTDRNWRTCKTVDSEWIGSHQGTRTFTYQGEPGKTYYLQINASNEAGLTSVYSNNPNVSGEGVSWTYRVIKATCPEVDTDIGPTITIDYVSCSRTITVKATSTDPSGIAAMTIFKKRSDQSSFDVLKECGAVTSCEASFEGEAGETYIVHIHAIDGDGNLAIKGVTVTCY